MRVPRLPILFLVLSSCVTPEAPADRVSAALAEYDRHLVEAAAAFGTEPKPFTTELTHRRDLDQYMRSYFMNTPADRGFSVAEREAFMKAASLRWQKLDKDNTEWLKGELAKQHGWFKISAFGAPVEDDAWLLVQHADLDHPFQRQVLALLEPLVKSGETQPSHYALLFDRLAVADHHPQRYGSQGHCAGPGVWEPDPFEGTPKSLDQRRAGMHLEPMDAYKQRFKTICR